MSSENSMRIDKWLWAVRIFKTRSLAADACKKGKIMMEGLSVKPSRMVVEGDIVDVRKPPVTRTYKVLKPIGNRVSAKIVGDYVEDLTPESEIAKLQQFKAEVFGVRDRGTGRPTKRDRRLIQQLKLPEEE